MLRAGEVTDRFIDDVFLYESSLLLMNAHLSINPAWAAQQIASPKAELGRKVSDESHIW